MKYPYPVMYQNVYCYDEMKRAEHMAVRETVGWYLWTHQIVEVTGKDATVFLEKLFPKPIGNLALSRERYTTMLDTNNGTIICKKGLLHPGDKILLHGHEAVICAPKFI